TSGLEKTVRILTAGCAAETTCSRFFFSSRRRHTRWPRDWSSDVCSSDLYTLRDAVQWLQDGAVVAFAGGRQRLTSGTQNMRGLRMLDDNFYGVPQAIAVPLDRTDRLQLVNAALDELRANGFLADSVARSGVEGLTVAPVDTPSR